MSQLYQDRLFRRVVVGSTGIGLACMLGSIAAVSISGGSGLQFRWHWSILVVAAAVIVWNGRFWNLVWELQDCDRTETRRKLAIHLGMLALLGAGSFLYPIRFVEQTYWAGILRGLFTAAAFLGPLFWILYKCGKGFAEIDSTELARLEHKVEQTDRVKKLKRCN